MIDYTIHTNQDDVHKDLIQTVQKHRDSRFQKPMNDCQKTIFSEVVEWVGKQNKPVILDACCGTGLSSEHLADAFSDHCVVGIDKSIKRLARNKADKANLLLVQADLIDFYRLASQQSFIVDKHFIFYPNPYPKASDLNKRWHGHAVFAGVLAICDQLEVRSNWRLYLDEFLLAAQCLKKCNGRVEILDDDNDLLDVSLFERKYRQNKQNLYRLQLF